MMGGQSLDASYFDGIFSGDDDPWGLASSAYEAGKIDRTIAALADRRYARALEVGCAHGVLTQRLLPLCDHLHAIDISAVAVTKAHARLGDLSGLILERLAFPREVPRERGFDLVLFSEVAYYWDRTDLSRACRWLCEAVEPAGRLLLVHWIGETDYPQSGDGVVSILWEALQEQFVIAKAERHERFRLDLWERR